MRKEKYFEFLKKREELKREILLAFSKLSADHVTEDHMQESYVINHIVKDHILQCHVTTEDHIENYPKGQHVTNDQHTILVGQQQPGNLKP